MKKTRDEWKSRTLGGLQIAPAIETERVRETSISRSRAYYAMSINLSASSDAVPANDRLDRKSDDETERIPPSYRFHSLVYQMTVR